MKPRPYTELTLKFKLDKALERFYPASYGDGTLAILTFEVVAVKASALTLSDVLLSVNPLPADSISTH